MWSLSRQIGLEAVARLSRVLKPGVGLVVLRKLNSESSCTKRSYRKKLLLSFVGASIGGLISYYNSKSLNFHIVSSQKPILERLKKIPTISAFMIPVKTAEKEDKKGKKGLVLGVYEKASGGKLEMVLSAAANTYFSSLKTSLNELFNEAGQNIKLGESRVFFGVDQVYSCVALVGLGPENAGINKSEDIDEGKENVRIAVAEGACQLRDLGCQTIEIDPCNDPEAAAEGASLGLFYFDELKSDENKKDRVNLLMYGSAGNREDWELGLLKGKGQNLARRLMELPANLLTPTAFAELTTEALASQNIQVTSRGKKWIVEQKMGSFFSVAKGSAQPPVFLELHYNGGKSKAKPIVLVGKGITFDSGGISLKPARFMEKMRADMGGGACIVATLHIIAALKMPVNVIGLIPLCENMPSGGASKPGDVVTAMNGTTIQVEDTDAEGRLILADALCYAHRFNPLVILDMATLTGSIMVALGEAAVGAFCTSSVMWKHIYEAGVKSGDRVWRMPLYKYYTEKVKQAHLADLNNDADYPRAGACTAAAFLKEFVTTEHWIHLDIAGVMECEDSKGTYIPEGMTGRPTRTVVEFIRILSSNPSVK